MVTFVGFLLYGGWSVGVVCTYYLSSRAATNFIVRNKLGVA